MFHFIFPLFTAGIYPCHSSLARAFQLPTLLTWVTNCSIFASMATVIDRARWEFLIEFCSNTNTKSIRAGISLYGLCPVPSKEGQTGSRTAPIYTTTSCPCLYFAKTDDKFRILSQQGVDTSVSLLDTLNKSKCGYFQHNIYFQMHL